MESINDRKSNLKVEDLEGIFKKVLANSEKTQSDIPKDESFKFSLSDMTILEDIIKNKFPNKTSKYQFEET